MSLICAQCLHLEETIHINGSAREMLIIKVGLIFRVFSFVLLPAKESILRKNQLR